MVRPSSRDEPKSCRRERCSEYRLDEGKQLERTRACRAKCASHSFHAPIRGRGAESKRLDPRQRDLQSLPSLPLCTHGCLLQLDGSTTSTAICRAYPPRRALALHRPSPPPAPRERTPAATPDRPLRTRPASTRVSDGEREPHDRRCRPGPPSSATRPPRRRPRPPPPTTRPCPPHPRPRQPCRYPEQRRGPATRFEPVAASSSSRPRRPPSSWLRLSPPSSPTSTSRPPSRPPSRESSTRPPRRGGGTRRARPTRRRSSPTS